MILSVNNQPAFLTRFRSEAAQMGMHTRCAADHAHDHDRGIAIHRGEWENERFLA